MSEAYDVMALVHDRARRDAALARLRREDPVHWDAQNDWWLVTRHADVREVSRDPGRFSSEPRGAWHAFEAHFSMQAMDGEPHQRHRSLVNGAFTPRMVRTLAERARVFADEAIDALRGRDHGDFVQDLAVPVPMRIIAEMLGVRDDRLDDFRRWTDATVAVAGGPMSTEELDRTTACLGEFHGWLSEEVERRRQEPGDDLLSRLIAADAAGEIEFGGANERMNSTEVVDFAMFLLVAGNETTRNAISQGMLTLFEHPHQRERLVANPDLWARAPGEILRWTTPIRAMRRVAMADAVLGGKRIREGESVVLVYASANQDEDVFEHPGEFRVDRDPNEFLSLGFGPHYCLGANLAQLEIRIVLQRILERLPSIALCEEMPPKPTESALIDGLESMPVRW
jgi:cytochrome P450